MSTGGNEWIAWVMHCVGPCASTISHTWKLLWSVFCYTALGVTTAHHVTCCRGVLLNLDPSPLSMTICVPGEPTLTAVHSFPCSKAPKKRLIWSLTSHLDDPEVRGQGCGGGWRGLHSSFLLCLDCPCCLNVLLFLCSWSCKSSHNLNFSTAWVIQIYILRGLQVFDHSACANGNKQNPCWKCLFYSSSFSGSLKATFTD